MTLAVDELIIPDVSGLSVREAVDAYRAAGLIVFPVRPGTKEPAVESWTTFGLDDPWPVGDYAIGLPMNRNRMVAIDVDHPDRAPLELAAVLEQGALQTTDADPDLSDTVRGHALFRTDADYSNAVSGLPGKGWGDVRAAGFVIVEPSPHSRPGGEYRWQRREVPPLPDQLKRWLTPAGEATHSGTSADLATFLSHHTEAAEPHALADDLAQFRARIQAGEPRNNVLPSAMGLIFRKAVNGFYSAQEAYDALEDLSNTPDPYESGRYEALAERFARTAMDDPGDLKPFRPVVLEGATDYSPSDFWTSRDTLRTIHQAAKSRMLGPYGLLGAVLVDIVAAIPPSIELDTYGGDHASLNMFVALVGPSGAGKSRIASAVRDVIEIPDRTYWQSLRSGEGLVSMFIQKRGKETERIADSAVIDMDEVDRLTALGQRTGATIMPTLRTAWVAGTLGGRAATSGLDLVLEHGSYRCNLVAGVQPGRSRALLSDADGGTPQRFVWLPANDPQAELDHEWPDPIEWGTLPPGPVTSLFGSRPATWLPTRNLTMPGRVLREWMLDAVVRARGEGDPLDAHKYLATAKLAAAFALLEMREDVSLEDWDLAKHLMNVSLVTREGLKRALAEQAESEARSRGRMEGMRQAAAELSAEAQRIERVSARLIKSLTEADGWVSQSTLNRKLSSRDRSALEDALDHLIETKQIEADGQNYRLRS